MSASEQSATRPPTNVVVVGNGMVGHRFCDELAARNDAHRFRITCIGEESRPAYDRVHLSEYFAGKTAEDLQLADAAWYAERGIELRLGERVTAIDAGYLDAIEEADKLIATTLRLASTMAQLPHPAFRETKRRERGAMIERTRKALAADVAELTTPIPQ